MSSSLDYRQIQSTIKPYVDLARPYNAVAAVLSFAVGYMLFMSEFFWRDFLIGSLIVAILHSVFTLQNDLYDLDVDKANHRPTPLTTGQISPNKLRQVIFYLILAAMTVAWFSYFKFTSLGFIAISMTAAWLYNAQPARLSRRPVSSLIILSLYYTVLPMSFGLYLNMDPTVPLILLISAFAIQRFSISILKDYKDVEGDRKLGKQTFLIAFGPKLTAKLSFLLGLVGYTACLVLMANITSMEGSLDFAILLVIAAGAAINVVNRSKLLKTGDYSKLTRIFQRSFIGDNYFNGLVLLWLTLS